MGEGLRLDRHLVDVRDDAVDAVLVVADDDVEPLEQARGVRGDGRDELAVILDAAHGGVEQLVRLREKQVDARRVDALHHRAWLQHRVLRRARIDRHELLAQHPLRGHVEVGVVVDGVAHALLDGHVGAHQDVPAALRVHLAAQELERLHAADLHARDAHRGPGLQASRVVEVDVDGEGLLEAQAAQHQDEGAEDGHGDEDERAHLHLDRAFLRHGGLSYRSIGPLASPRMNCCTTPSSVALNTSGVPISRTRPL